MATEDIREAIRSYTGGEGRAVRDRAYQVHAAVNQHYDDSHPYGFHLDMVTDTAMRFLPSLGERVVPDIAAVHFGAMFHDSIEDARLTYNDLMQIACEYLPERQVVTAVEIAYALTNDKGRTRAERAGERYYSGIRCTPYAPLVKLADRIANFAYSLRRTNTSNFRMAAVYASEMAHFLRALTVSEEEAERDWRLLLPPDMLAHAVSLMPQDQ